MDMDVDMNMGTGMDKDIDTHSCGCTRAYIPVSVGKNIRRMIHVGKYVFRAPNQGQDRSFCRWIAEQRLAGLFLFTDTGIYTQAHTYGQFS